MPTDTFLFTSQVWNRFKKNRSAVFGLVVIGIMLFCAIFCYVIAPDSSPNADIQTLEIQAKDAGYKQLFLKISPPQKNDAGWLQEYFFGKQPLYRYIPISNYQIKGDSLVIDKFVDEDTSVIQYYSVNQITGNRPDKISSCIVYKTYWLGTDKFGRDILSRLLIGTRVSFLVGLIAVLISLTVGIILGGLAGYYKGWVDECIMWLLNITWSIPTLLLVFAITLSAGKGFWQIFIAIGLTMWVSVARLIRGQVMALKKQEYVLAAKALGFKHGRIIGRHILPNIAGPVMVIAAGNFATAIIIEAGLSFLGIGVQPPQPSWGLMIKENYNFIITNRPLLALVPGLAIMLLVLAFNLLGMGLRDAVDVKN